MSVDTHNRMDCYKNYQLTNKKKHLIHSFVEPRLLVVVCSNELRKWVWGLDFYYSIVRNHQSQNIINNKIDLFFLFL